MRKMIQQDDVLYAFQQHQLQAVVTANSRACSLGAFTKIMNMAHAPPSSCEHPLPDVFLAPSPLYAPSGFTFLVLKRSQWMISGDFASGGRPNSSTGGMTVQYDTLVE